MYPSIPSTPSSILLQKSVPPPLSAALYLHPRHKRERTLSAVIMFSLFTGLYTASVGGNQVEGRYYATPSTTSKLDLPRVSHAGEKSQRSGTRTVVICVERFVSTHSTPLLRASRGLRTVDFLISKIEYGEYRDKLVDKRDKIRVRASLFIELKKKKLESGRKRSSSERTHVRQV